MGKLHEVKIIMSDIGIGRIWLDDMEILGVRDIKVKIGAGDLSKVTIQLVPGNVEFLDKLVKVGVKMGKDDDPEKQVGGGERDG